MTKETIRKYRTYPLLQKTDTVKHYEKYGIKLAMEAMCVPRSTIYRWVKLKKSGIANWEQGLSKRPKHLGMQKITDELRKQIITLKENDPQMPYKQILSHLPIRLSESSICRVLKKHNNS